jgi:arylsulfatase A-like enzyme
VYSIAADWLQRRGQEEDWFLHVHMWDPHTPYRAPAEMGDPFADDPLPSWYNEQVRSDHWHGCGPHSARENYGYQPNPAMLARFPRQPQEAPDLTAARKMFDGYDLGVKMADDYVGRLMNLLSDLNIDADTIVMVSSDHGENLGELNVYGDHQTADQITTRIPLILHWPAKLSPQRFAAKHYHIDITATLLDMLEMKIPNTWDGESFAKSLAAGKDEGRDYLVLSQAAWACQRGVRFGDHIYLKTLHDAYHLWPEEMLFNVVKDPHQQKDLATPDNPHLLDGRKLLQQWLIGRLPSAARGGDPHLNVMREGGPYHVRGKLKDYLQRLHDTDRTHLANELSSKYPDEL